MGLDFYGVSIYGRLITFSHTHAGSGPNPATVQKKVYELWTDPGSDTNVPGLLALSYVAQLNVITRMGMNSEISLTLTPPWEDGLALLNSNLIEFGQNYLEVQFGYSSGDENGAGGRKSPVWTGLLLAPEVQIGSDIVITLHARGVGYAMNVVGEGEPQTFDKGKTPFDVVKQVLSKYDKDHNGVALLDLSDLDREIKGSQNQLVKKFFQAVPERTDTPPQNQQTDKKKASPSNKNVAASDANLPSPTDSGTNAAPQPIAISKAAQTDWLFVKRLTEEYGLQMLIEGNKLVLRDQNVWLKDVTDQTKEFSIRGKIDVDRKVFPILTLSSPTSALFLHNGMGGYKAEEVGENSKQHLQVKIDQNSEKPTQARQGTVDYTLQRSSANVPLDALANAGINPETEAINRVGAEVKSNATKRGVVVDVETIGIPDLLPGEVIRVSGFTVPGKQNLLVYDGLYGVLEAAHSAGIGGYTTSFHALAGFWPSVYTGSVDNPGDTAKDNPQNSSPTGNGLTGSSKTVTAQSGT